MDSDGNGPAGQAPQEPDGRQGGRLLRVLVVDGDGDNAETMALLLRLYGHEARCAPDGPAVPEPARPQRPGAGGPAGPEGGGPPAAVVGVAGADGGGDRAVGDLP